MTGEILLLATGFLGGVGLLVVADRLRRRSQRGAQIFAASGLVALFVSCVVATETYALVPWWVGLGLSFLTAMTAGVLSVRHGYVSAILGVAGGLAAGVSLPAESADLAPFTYLALLLFGMLFIPSLITRIPWKRVAPRLGLELHLPFPPAAPWLEGMLRGFDVRVSQYDKAIRIEVDGVDPGFTLRRESTMAKMTGSDVETGDADFDRRTLIKGDVDLALALLDSSTRQEVNRLLSLDGGKASEARVSDGNIRKRVFEFKEIRPTLDSMLDLAEVLRRPSPEEVPTLLSRRALEDPSPGLRLRAFHRLATSFYRSEEVRQTARLLRDSENPQLRLEASRVLVREPAPEGADAAGELMDLARNQTDSSLRISALDAAANSAFHEDCVPKMVELLQTPGTEPQEVREAALRGLAKARALDELLRVQLTDDPDEAVELARSLGQIGDARAQPRLFELLRHPRDRVKAEAAEALGAIGDARAVEELRKALDSGLLTKLTVGRAAESAIVQIKSRLGGQQAGEISITTVEPLEGAVSKADGPEDTDPEDTDSEGTEGGEISLTP